MRDPSASRVVVDPSTGSGQGRPPPRGPISFDEAQPLAARLRDELGRAIIGQHGVVQEILTAFFAGGHCLLRGVPGLAKTLLIKTLAQAVHLKFNRIQFTPDLMPSDIIGTEVIEEDRGTGRREIRSIPGPMFANVILADEINRTPPKTQALVASGHRRGPRPDRGPRAVRPRRRRFAAFSRRAPPDAVGVVDDSVRGVPLSRMVGAEAQGTSMNKSRTLGATTSSFSCFRVFRYSPWCGFS